MLFYRYFLHYLHVNSVATVSQNAAGTHQPLTLALGATIASSRPRAFGLPSLLVGSAKLFAVYKKCTARVPLIAMVVNDQTPTYIYNCYIFIL